MVKRREVIELFRSYGFEVVGGTNHDKLIHPDGRWTTLGRHTEIDNEMLKLMKKQAGIK